MSPLRPLLALLPVVGLAGSIGCALLAGLDGDRHIVDAGAGGSGTGGAACVPAVPPGPPKVKNAGGAEELVAAVRTMDLGEGMGATGVGFDLDGVCTCPGPTSCVSSASTVSATCDTAGGRDDGIGNAFFKINAAFSPAAIISSVELSQRANLGSWTILVRVRGYDGKPDDDQVDVSLYLTTGFTGHPAWDGTDAWPVADVSLADQASLDQPAIHDPNAYVSGGVLVARFPAAALLFLGAGVQLQVELTSVVLTATLQPTDAGAYRLVGGNMGAVWKLADVFNDLSGLRLNGGDSLCTDSAYYLIVKNALCGAADLLAGGGSPDAGCDALSFGMTFEGYPAQLGAVTPLAPPSGGCAADKDPKTDTCDG